MTVSTDPKHTNGRFINRLIGAAGGAILAGSLGIVIFSYFRASLPNEIVAIIAGLAGGLVSIVQRACSNRAKRGEEE